MLSTLFISMLVSLSWYKLATCLGRCPWLMYEYDRGGLETGVPLQCYGHVIPCGFARISLAAPVCLSTVCWMPLC